ncbi:MAG: hypothetical protein DME26_08975 [Verrucomicrobia bacterium]|nr:MAG: hypothetical protein DME26_08975 [Verrucomicrobiota bacterium]
MKFWRVIPAVLIGAGLYVYSNSFSGAFVFDDLRWIVDNPRLRHLWPLDKLLAGSTRPTVQLSLAVNYAVGGLNVWGYHAFNVATHILAGLVLFGIVRRTLESDRLRLRYGRAAPWLAMGVALLWMVHPLQTESVTYVIQRAESLMGLFYLLTLYCGIRGGRSARPVGWFAGGVAACLLGMGSKEVMVSAPIMVLLYDRVFISKSFAEIFRKRWGFYAGLAVIWLIGGALLANSPLEETAGFLAGVEKISVWDYAKTQCGVIVYYLRLCFWPYPLVLDYIDWPLAKSLVSVLPAAVVVLTLLGGTVWAWLRQPWLGFLGAWFFLILAPTSSFLPIRDLIFEHRLYLPLAAIVTLVVIGGHEALVPFLRRAGVAQSLQHKLEIGLVVALAGGLGYRTVRRNEDYRSQFSIWRDTVAKRRNNPRAHCNLGVEFHKLGQTKDAIASYSEALRLKPDYPDAHVNLGVALVEQGQVQEAIGHYLEAARLRPHWQINEAIAQFVEAVRLKPDYAEAYNNLGEALCIQGRVKEAIPHFEQAVRLNSASAEAHHNLGVCLYSGQRIDEALPHFAEAVRLKHDWAEAQNNLGAALSARGRNFEAIVHFAEAVRLKPGYTEARDNLRRAQALQPINTR